MLSSDKRQELRHQAQKAWREASRRAGSTQRRTADDLPDSGTRAECVERLLAQRKLGPPPGSVRPGVGLVVGDRPDRIGLLHDALHEHLGRVWTANDEPTATAVAIAEQPDIAVIDEDVAGFSGFDTALTIRDFSPATCIVLVIDDDSEAEVDIEQAEMLTGGVASIEKLDRTIRRFLD